MKLFSWSQRKENTAALARMLVLPNKSQLRFCGRKAAANLSEKLCARLAVASNGIMIILSSPDYLREIERVPGRVANADSDRRRRGHWRQQREIRVWNRVARNPVSIWH
jgi:hypothetical protein